VQPANSIEGKKKIFPQPPVAVGEAREKRRCRRGNDLLEIMRKPRGPGKHLHKSSQHGEPSRGGTETTRSKKKIVLGHRRYG